MTPKEAHKIFNSGRKIVVHTLSELSRTIDDQKKKIETLEIKIAKLSKNSSNSGKRPSSDDFTKKPKKQKTKGKRTIGGQPGHSRNLRPLFAKEEIDKFYSYLITACPDCNEEVFPFVEGEPRIVQQIELKEIPVVKEEHSSFPVWCSSCKKVHYSPMPPEIAAEGLFKTRLTALVAYMKHVCHASFSTIRKFVRDILGQEISRGYLRKVIEKVGHSLEKPYQELLDRLPLETCVNVDETGHKDNRDRFWTWVFKAELYVLFKIDKSRGSQVLIEVLGKEFDGTLGCDYFSAYRKYMKDFNVTIQFCLAHLIRDVKFLVTFPDPETRQYGKRLLAEIKSMFQVIHKRDKMESAAFGKALEEAKIKIMEMATKDVPSKLDKKGKETKRAPQNMAKRFRLHGTAYFEFITTPGVDPTNNTAERAVRFIVIDRHVTQGTRSPKGRITNERIWTVIGTCAIQGRSAFEFIRKAVQAFFQKQPAPSLLPNSS